MKEELKPITLIRGYIPVQSINDGKPHYVPEPEFGEWVGMHAKFFKQRYDRGEGSHWKENEQTAIIIGLAGQKAFEVLLQEIEVPYIPNDPMLDQRLKKSYDFKIPRLGTVEVKTIDHYCRKVLIKVSEWHGNNFLSVWKLDEQKELDMIGWLTKEQVEAHPKTPRGATKFNPYSDSYIIDLSELNPPETFIQKLGEAKIAMFS